MSAKLRHGAAEETEDLIARLGTNTPDAIAKLASGVAHELRNPLAVILARVQLLKMTLKGPHAPDAAKLDRALQAIEEQALRASKTIEALTIFARPRAPQASPLEIRAAILQAVERLAAAGRIAEGVVAEVDVPEGLPAVTADPALLTAALVELIENGVEAMPTGGIVRIAAEVRGETMVVTVSDGGAGIDPQDAPRIFDPFFTTKPGAAGLGLCTAYTVARAHGGTLKLGRSGPEGSTFVLGLPLAGPKGRS